MCLQPYLFALWALTTLKLTVVASALQSYSIILALCRRNNRFFPCNFCTKKKVMKECCKDHPRDNKLMLFSPLGIVLAP